MSSSDVADPKAPDLFQRLLAFMREADEWGTPADVLRSAEDAGLVIVSEADKRVLEAMGNAHPRALKNPRTYGEDLIESCDAELARRSGT